jgi:diphthamide biosynthesis protein 2
LLQILVGTLAVSKYLDMLQHLQNIIKKANKTFYTFVVGKLNVPKLANFQEVDLFVIVACPENSILDSKDFFKPVVTPFELEIALVPGKSWNNRYSTEFKTLLEETPTADYFAKNVQDDETDSDARVSLVSRSIKSNHKVSEVTETVTETAPDGTVVVRNQNTQVMRRDAPTAMDFFLQRSFKGLEQQLGETPVITASVGRPGIPMEYEGEPAAATTEEDDDDEVDLDDQIQSENA